jgi:hypothetical protein
MERLEVSEGRDKEVEQTQKVESSGQRGEFNLTTSPNPYSPETLGLMPL